MRKLLLSLICAFLVLKGYSEGTQQLTGDMYPDAGQLAIFPGDPLFNFATENCPADKRLNISITQAGETISFGFRQQSGDLSFRLKRPDGTVAMTYTPVPSSTGLGYISGWNDAYYGGYTPFEYQADMPGEWYLEFSGTYGPQYIMFFDINVLDAGGSLRQGRVWSRSWQFYTAGFDFGANLPVITNEGFISFLQIGGLNVVDPFILEANSNGTSLDPDPVLSLRSKPGKAGFPEYPIFLVDPDPMVFPEAPAPNVFLSGLNFTSCAPDIHNIEFDCTEPGYAEVWIDVDGIAGMSAQDVVLPVPNVTPGYNQVMWDGRDGNGNPAPDGNINIEVQFYLGEVNALIFNGVDLSGWITPSGTTSTPYLFWDDTEVGGGVSIRPGCYGNGCRTWTGGANQTRNTRYFNFNISTAGLFTKESPFADAGPDQTRCILNPGEGYPISGYVMNSSANVLYNWATSGTGVFDDPTQSYPTYYPSSLDSSAGNVTLTLMGMIPGCPTLQDEMILTLASVNAGPDVEVCAGESVTLQGAHVNGGNPYWSGGDGTYSSTLDLNAVYTPSSAEAANGYAYLNLYGETCAGLMDYVQITIHPAPLVGFELAAEYCGNAAVQELMPSPAGGTFTGPGINFENKFDPALAPTGTAVTVTYEYTDAITGCTGSTSKNTLVHAPPLIDFTMPAEFCRTGGSVNLTASPVGGTFVGDGVSGSGYFDPSVPATSPVTISYTYMDGSTGCSSTVSNSAQLYDPPAANAGADLTVCSGSAVQLNGSISNASSFSWVSSGTGTFSPSPTTLNPQYIPSGIDEANGTVTLTLTAAGVAGCPNASDDVVLTITPAPTVNAGPDQAICASQGTVQLSGTVTVATGAMWSGGTGAFSPDATTLNAIYQPSAAEISSGTVTLALTTTGNGNCTAVSDQVTIQISQDPVVNAGPDLTICSDGDAQLSGTVQNATGATWTTTGTGIFSPDGNTLNPIYTPSSADITNGSVMFTLTSTGNGNCAAVSDQVTLTITPAPTVSAGIDQSVCYNGTGIQLNGTITVATGAMWSGGAGTFSPDATALSAIYQPAASEISSGAVTLTLTTTGNGNCNAVSDQVTIQISPEPVVNAGPDLGVCAGSDASLSGTVQNATGGTWSTTGTGVFSPDANTLTVLYTPSSADITNGSVMLTLTSTGNGNCTAVSDQVMLTITPAPTANAGPDQAMCTSDFSTQLSGTITGATGATWTGGTGTYNPDDLNTTYIFSGADVTSGSITLTLTTTGNGNCPAASDQMQIAFAPQASAYAGPDQTSCSGSNIQLMGDVQNGTNPAWTTTGTGTFSPDANTLNAVYTPSSQDIADGSVMLTLSAAGNGNCPSVTDQMNVTFTPAPTADAGIDQSVCYAGTGIQLNGTISGATGAMWTGGSGTFSPDATTLNAVYMPGASEVSVILTLTTTGNGNCTAVSDQVQFAISYQPAVNAGPDANICSGRDAQLNGTVQNATGGTWTTSGTGAFSNAGMLSTSYTPSSGDLANGSVTLTLTSTGNGSCTAVSDQVVLTFVPAPTADAGIDQAICASGAAIPLTGSVTNATGGTWSSTGTGIFSPDANTLNASYTPSAADISAGVVMLILNSTGNGNCNPASDTMNLVLTPAPSVNAGSDQVVCQNVTSVQLNGTSANATQHVWTTSGSGTFSPNADALNATYVPSSQDKAADNVVTLTLTASAVGCNSVSDAMSVTFIQEPSADAGVNQTVCANKEVSLAGTVSGASGGKWSGGGGSFIPNANTLNAVYVPTSTERENGSLIMILTSTGNNGCDPVSDFVQINFTPAPIVDAGPNDQMTASPVQLDGRVQNATGGVWSSSGTGIFSPSAADLNAAYTPSSDDLNGKKVTLTLTSTGNGACNAASDQMVLTSNQVVCNVDMELFYNQNVVTFAASNTDGQSVGSYAWDFGDGNTGSGKFQSNVYNEPGVYYVSVFYTTPDSACTAVGYDTVNISQAAIPTFTISGVVKAGGVNLDNSTLTLFRFDGRNYDYLRALDITDTDNGVYAFSGLENGYYLVHALPAGASAFFNSHLATYYGNDTIWEEAAFIQINNADFTAANIDLMDFVPTNTTWNTGVDDVSGVITFDQGVTLKVTGSENPVENAVVTLYSSEGERLTSTYTDPFGNYSFDDLDVGSYTIDVEYAGTNMSGAIEVTADGSGSKVDGTTSLVKEDLELGLFTKGKPALKVVIYPNPASEYISVELPDAKGGALSARIFNSAGVIVQEGAVTGASGTVTIPVSDLDEGFYLIELNNGNQVWRERFLKH